MKEFTLLGTTLRYSTQRLKLLQYSFCFPKVSERKLEAILYRLSKDGQLIKGV